MVTRLRFWFLIFFILISISINSFAGGNWNGWVYQSAYPTDVSLGDVKFISPLKGWIVGKYGSIFYTNDGGETWEALESGTKDHLLKVVFVNEKSGWMARMDGTIMHTEDGGKTWVSQMNIHALPRTISFLNDQEGWVAGAIQTFGVLYHTRNGGKTWERVDAGINRAISALFFLNSQTGWILAGEDVYRTTNGGKQLLKSKLPVGKVPYRRPRQFIGDNWISDNDGGLGSDWFYGGITFANEKQGWAVVYHWIFNTNDGGQTWMLQFDTGLGDHALGTIAFRDALHGCAAGWSVVCTDDGGKSWTERLGAAQRDDEGLGGVSLINHIEGWTVGRIGRIYKTSDGGKSWKAPFTQLGCGHRITLVDNKMRWMWGTQKTSMCETEDGGQTWTRREVGMQVRDLFFVYSEGWALGCQTEGPNPNKPDKVYQVVKHTADGGNTWELQFKEPTESKDCFESDLFSVFFVNHDNGWLVGNNGRILHTNDGGMKWKSQKSGTALNLREVHFSNDEIGMVSGDRSYALGEDRENDAKASGKILYTSDGGKHWRTVWQSKPVLLTGSYFLNKHIGWVTAETLNGNLLLRTENGGKTWKEQPLNIIGYSPYSPYFIDDKKGVLFIEDTSSDFDHDVALLITFDGGATWSKRKLPLHKRPWSISELFKNNPQ